MIARWDEALPEHRREHGILKILALVSLDVARAIALDLGLDEGTRVRLLEESRRVLEPYFGELFRDKTKVPATAPMLAAMDPELGRVVRRLYDALLRYADGDAPTLFCWTIVLSRCDRDAQAWASLGLPEPISTDLRAAFRRSHGARRDVLDRLDEAFARPLSSWDARVASAGFFPKREEDGLFGISDDTLASYARTMHKLAFWKTAAAWLGPAGTRDLRERAQAFLDAQPDIREAFGALADPWLLAYPERAEPPSVGPEVG